ncbi:MAG: ABC transporter permease, partial [Acidobacteria bacterium]|nr:ABC transporter permease [Acidobacteriota bacterium]
MTNVAGAVGRLTLNLLAAGVRVSVLMVETVSSLVLAPFQGKKLRLRAAVESFVEFGTRSLPIVGMISFLVGVIIALQSSYTLEQWGANRFIATLVAVSALREMAPLMTAILITGRSGSAITAEIGTMQVNEEIDALEVMGIDPIRYLVVPRFVAMVAAVPAVTVVAMFIMVAGGLVASVVVVGVPTSIYLDQTVQALAGKDLLIGLTKSVFFGVAICWV